MRRMTIILGVLAFCLLMLPAQNAQAFGLIGDAMLEFYPDMCEDLQLLVDDCSMCHENGFFLNPYGEELIALALSFGDIEHIDSDADGRTNGEEILNDCSAPGDATSAVEPATWSSIKVLFE